MTGDVEACARATRPSQLVRALVLIACAACSARPQPIAATATGAGAGLPAVSALDAASEPLDDTPVELVAGAFHTCARTRSGGVACWGANRATPARVAGIADAVELAAGEEHTCARLAGGGVSCWEDANAPVRVAIDGVVSISAGRDHSCALRHDDTAWCWGANDRGQASEGDPAKVIATPARVDLAHVAEVHAGVNQSCARTRDGTVACWGDRDALRGQARRPLAAVAGIAGAAELAVGLFGACARIDKRVRCWPTDDFDDVAALDDITRLVGSDDRYCAISSAREVSCWTGSFGWTHLRRVVRMPSLDDADQIALGRFHSCALRAGVISCSGENLRGQLGNGTQGFVLTPVRVPGLRGATHVELDGHQAPCAVIAGAVSCVRSSPPATLRGVVEVGGECARLATGSIVCWGDNRVAQLGRVEPRFAKAPLPVPGITGATSLSASGSRRCAVARSRVRCWGNDSGVSIHDLSAQPKRVEVRPVEIPKLRDAVAVSLGFSLGCALLANKTVSCWKARDYDAGTVARYADSKPEVVAGLTGVAQISVGRDTAAAVREDGSIVMWGRDLELGLRELPPTQVAGVTDAAEIRLGQHACVRHRDGRVSCWGKVVTRDGVLLDSRTPVPIAGITNAVGLATAGDHDCARLADGDVACWGTNHSEELGVPLGEEAPPSLVAWPPSR